MLHQMFMKAKIDIFYFKVINHKFLVARHAHMESDIDHSMIETRRKNLKFQYITFSEKHWEKARIPHCQTGSRKVL